MEAVDELLAAAVNIHAAAKNVQPWIKRMGS